MRNKRCIEDRIDNKRICRRSSLIVILIKFDQRIGFNDRRGSIKTRTMTINYHKEKDWRRGSMILFWRHMSRTSICRVVLLFVPKGSWKEMRMTKISDLKDNKCFFAMAISIILIIIFFWSASDFEWSRREDNRSKGQQRRVTLGWRRTLAISDFVNEELTGLRMSLQ